MTPFRVLLAELDHFAEAAVLFERVAEGDPEHVLPANAFLRWLETTNVLLTVFDVMSCSNEMDQEVPLQGRPALRV